MHKSNNETLIIGDLHGYWKCLRKLIDRHNPKRVLSCGDFGFWPHFDKFLDGEGLSVPTYWCDGNHENHDILQEEWQSDKLEEREILENVFYMKRGSILTLPDSRNILFMGGADSIDKNVRTPYVSWWPQEVITQKEVYNLPDIRVNIVISHTCPREFKLKDIDTEKNNDPSMKALSYILDKYHPSLWYFGHFHIHQIGYINDCKWTCLNMVDESGWFNWLED